MVATSHGANRDMSVNVTHGQHITGDYHFRSFGEQPIEKSQEPYNGKCDRGKQFEWK